MNRETIISLRDLRFGYEAHKTVLNGLSLDIPTGTVTSILGPNGTGKTTLLNTILGLYKPQGGEIIINGHSLSSYSRRDLSRIIGLVPQSEEVPFNYSVLEFVMLGRTPHMGLLSMPSEKDYAMALNTLSLLGISDLEARSVQDLSGGERQMVLLARALAQDPKVLLLDEPTSHLDLSNTGNILNILKELSRSRCVSVIFTTHDPDAAFAIAGQALLIYETSALAFGPVEKVLTGKNLSHAYRLPVEVRRVDGRFIVMRKEETH